MYSVEILPKSCSYSTPVNKSLKIQLNKEFGDTNNFLMNTFLFKKIKIKKIPKLFIRTWLSCKKFFFLMLVTNCKLSANSKGIPITGLCVNLINLKLLLVSNQPCYYDDDQNLTFHLTMLCLLNIFCPCQILALYMQRVSSKFPIKGNDQKAVLKLCFSICGKS